MNEDVATGEYEAINFDGLERRANYRTIAYREDMLHVFGKRDAAAMIYQIIYRWQTDYKREEIFKEINRRKMAKLPPLTPEEVDARMWVFMSYNDFVRETGGALGYNTVIRTLAYLVNDIHIIEQRANHDPRYPDYEYRINKDVARHLLKALPTEPAFCPKVPKKKESSTHLGTETEDSTHLGTPPHESTQMGIDSTQTGIATTQMGTEVYPFGGTSHITHSDHTDRHTEESTLSSLPLDAPPPSQKKAYVAPVLSQQSEEEHQRILALFGRPCDTCGRTITTPDCPWCATVRVPAVAPPKQSTPPLTGRVAAVAASSLPTPLSDAAPAPPDRPEEAPAQPQLVALPAKRPRKKAEPLPAMSEEATLVWQRWRSLFTRETPLTRRDMEAAEQLAACTPTAEELGACRKWLFTTDNPERPWYRRIGVGLPDVAKNWARWQSLQDAPPIDLQLVKKVEGPRLPPPMPSDEELRKQVY